MGGGQTDRSRAVSGERPRILVTGAAGYLGSHVVVALAEAGYDVIGIDNFSRSDPAMLRGLAERLGEEPRIEALDCRDAGAVARLLRREAVGAVVHLAGYKSVVESWHRPGFYMHNNVGAAASLVDAMTSTGVRQLIFSSSCTVYGEPERLPVDESLPRRPLSPYGRSKAVIEAMLDDVTRTDPEWSITSLRYFNPVGADASGLIGEHPEGTPTTLVPNLLAAATGDAPHAVVHGLGHPTRDGSCVRDFIHVSDLSAAHVSALGHLRPGHDVYDIAAGNGTSVLEMVHAVERVLGVVIPLRVADRRPGDAAAIWASGRRARDELEWEPTRTLEDMIRDHWRWHRHRLDADGPLVA